MTIVELIKRDHDEIAELFDHLLVLSRDDRRIEEATRIATRLVTVSRIHCRAEERVFYEALKTADARLKAFALGGPHEHENLDTTLDKLLVRRAGDDEYRVIVKVARDLFEMHARDEEEGDVLPIVNETLSPEELRTLGSDMLAESARIRPQVLRLVGTGARAA